MAVSRALGRLLRVRELGEEQSRLALESALGELSRMRQALARAAERNRWGRGLVAASARSGEFPDRLAGLEEARAADTLSAALGSRIADAEQGANRLREDYLARRVERRQAETLIEESAVRDALDAGRHNQQSLDDWYRNRQRRTGAARGRVEGDAVAESVRSAVPGQGGAKSGKT